MDKSVWGKRACHKSGSSHIKVNRKNKKEKDMKRAKGYLMMGAVAVATAGFGLAGCDKVDASSVNELGRVQEQLRDAEKSVGALEAQIGSLGAELAAEKAKLATASSNLTAVQAAYDAADRDLKSAEAALTVKAGELKTANEALATAEGALAEAETALGEKEAALEAAEATVAKKTAIIAAKKATIATMTTASEALAEEIAGLETELAIAQASVASLTTAKGELEETINEMVAIVVNPLRVAKEALEASVASLTSAKSALEGQVAGLSEQKATLEAQVAALNGTIGEKEFYIAELEGIVAGLKGDVEARDAEILRQKESFITYIIESYGLVNDDANRAKVAQMYDLNVDLSLVKYIVDRNVALGNIIDGVSLAEGTYVSADGSVVAFVGSVLSWENGIRLVKVTEIDEKTVVQAASSPILGGKLFATENFTSILGERSFEDFGFVSLAENGIAGTIAIKLDDTRSFEFVGSKFRISKGNANGMAWVVKNGVTIKKVRCIDDTVYLTEKDLGASFANVIDVDLADGMYVSADNSVKIIVGLETEWGNVIRFVTNDGRTRFADSPVFGGKLFVSKEVLANLGVASIASLDAYDFAPITESRNMVAFEASVGETIVVGKYSLRVGKRIGAGNNVHVVISVAGLKPSEGYIATVNVPYYEGKFYFTATELGLAKIFDVTGAPFVEVELANGVYQVGENFVVVGDWYHDAVANRQTGNVRVLGWNANGGRTASDYFYLDGKLYGMDVTADMFVVAEGVEVALGETVTVGEYEYKINSIANPATANVLVRVAGVKGAAGLVGTEKQTYIDGKLYIVA